MNFFLKQKAWFFIALFFMIVTIVLLTGIFLHRGHRSFGRDKKHGDIYFTHNRYKNNYEAGRSPLTQLIIDSLGFTSQQQTKLVKINEEMNLKKDSLFKENEKCKDLFTEELYAENLNKKRLDSLMKCISYNSEKYNQLRIDNMEKIRSHCTPAQKKKLPIILKEFIAHKNIKRRHH